MTAARQLDAARYRDRISARLQPLWRRGFRLLFVVDAVVLYGIMVAITTIRFGLEWPEFSRGYYLAGFAIATVIHLVVGYLAGLYEREPRLAAPPWLPRVALAMAIGVAVEGFVFVIFDRFLMPRFNLLVLAIVGTVGLTATRQVSRTLARRRDGPARLLLVGDANECAVATQHLRESAPNTLVAGRAALTAALPEAVAAYDPSDVLLLRTSAYTEIFPAPLGALEAAGIGVFQQVSAAQTLLGLSGLRELGGMPFVPLRAQTFPSYKYTLKRSFDLVVLLIASPFIVGVGLAAAMYVRIRAGSPVLYRQTRVGRGGRSFQMVKFRTMRPDAEAAGAQLSSHDDDRVVRGLGWMRGTRLDELPQLWHVLTGKMSIVGPRPERPVFTEQLAVEVPGYERRFELPPGLTGLAQVHGRYATAAEYKVGYDLQYLSEWSIILDLEIMVRTIWVVVSRRV